MDKAELAEYQILRASLNIALDLMTAGNSDREVADSLQLYCDGVYLGGWSLPALAERIRKHLSGELEAMEREPAMLNKEIDGRDE